MAGSHQTQAICHPYGGVLAYHLLDTGLGAGQDTRAELTTCPQRVWSSTGVHSPSEHPGFNESQSAAADFFLKPDVYYKWVSFQFSSFEETYTYGHL